MTYSCSIIITVNVQIITMHIIILCVHNMPGRNNMQVTEMHTIFDRWPETLTGNSCVRNVMITKQCPEYHTN